jgi:HK97 family phage portal protein
VASGRQPSNWSRFTQWAKRSLGLLALRVAKATGDVSSDPADAPALTPASKVADLERQLDDLILERRAVELQSQVEYIKANPREGYSEWLAKQRTGYDGGQRNGVVVQDPLELSSRIPGNHRRTEQQKRSEEERASIVTGLAPSDPGAVSLWGYSDTTAGVNVTVGTALNYSACFAAINLLSNCLGQIPARLDKVTWKNGEKTCEVAFKHPVHRLIRRKPNPWMTRFHFWKLLESHRQSHGNCYAEIIWNGFHEPVRLDPIHPEMVRPDWLDNGDLLYTVRGADGTERQVKSENMYHVPMFTLDGRYGMSPITAGRENVGIGIAATRYGASFYGQGSTPGGVIRHPGKLSDRGAQNLRESWERVHKGSGNAHRVAVLEEGAEYQPFTIPMEDSQFLNTRKFEVIEMARWYNVPPHMLRDLERATFSNIDEQGQEFVTYSLQPHLIAHGEEICRKLLTEEEQEQYEVCHQTRCLEKADVAVRSHYYATGRQWGWLSANDVRQEEGMNPVEGGDVYLSPGNMQDAKNPPSPEPFKRPGGNNNGTAKVPGVQS